MGPIRGQTRPAPVAAGIASEVQHIDAKINASIHNRFDIEIINAETGEVRQRAQAENVICNQLWAYLLSNSDGNYFRYIQYGSGSGTPSASDTALFTYAGCDSPAASDDVFANNTADCWCSCRRKIQLSESTAVGTTISEVGIAYSSSGSLATHAMLKDMSGNQITIAKTSTDIVNIYATIFVHYAATGDSGKLKMCPLWMANMAADKTDYGACNRLLAYLLGVERWNYIPDYSYMMASSGGLGPFSMYRHDSSQIHFESKASSFDCRFTPSRDASNKKITLEMTRIAAASGNVGGVRGVAICSAYSNNWDVTYPSLPWFVLDIGGSGLPASIITGESIATGDGSTKDFCTAFDCVSDAKIYVDGAQTTAVTVDAGVPLDYSNMGKYFQFEPLASSENLHYTPSFNNTNIAYYENSSPVGYAVFYNPFYALGISSLTCSKVIISVSDDLTNWTQIVTGSQSGAFSVNAEYQTKKYWKIETTQTTQQTSGSYCYGLTTAGATGKNIHFSTAPASGAVITADYTAEAVAKDANHVFDLTVTIQLGEYTG